MENYFNYFTEIEEHFQRRRGSILLLSTLDWALIETWKDAGIPLEAVLRGIDEAFDSYDRRSSKTRKVNSLAYCSQEVLAASEDMKEAAVGTSQDEKSSRPVGFENSQIATFLLRNAGALESAALPEGGGVSVGRLAKEIAANLRELAGGLGTMPRLEDLERRMAVMEEKLFAALMTATPDEELVTIRAQADRELSPYRRKMSAPQIDQLQKQYLNKKLLEKHGLPRLSLFYM